MTTTAHPILSAGRNCWTADAALDSAGLVIDARAYYRAFYHAARQARRYVLIAGWRLDRWPGASNRTSPASTTAW